jgi:thioredoxin 1
MTYQARYAVVEPTPSDVERMPGHVVLEFGAPWCGHCHAAQPALEEMLASHPDATHLKIEDGKGRPLGRAFGVRLWPTVIVLEQGSEIIRAVRPESPRDLHLLAAVLKARTGAVADSTGHDDRRIHQTSRR